MGMIGPSSRYKLADIQQASCHTYDSDGNPDLDSTGKPTVSWRETSYLLATGEYTQPPYEYMTKQTDNMWLLATNQLGDAQKWWIIADSNPQIRYPLDLKMADVIYLPE